MKPNGIRLARMGFGFVVARIGLFLHEIEAVRHNSMPKASTGLSLWIGTALILLRVIANLLVAAASTSLVHPLMRRTIRAGESRNQTKSHFPRATHDISGDLLKGNLARPGGMLRSRPMWWMTSGSSATSFFLHS
jgi:membrane carboxypeptidase/penicillin-binding protein PbpC